MEELHKKAAVSGKKAKIQQLFRRMEKNIESPVRFLKSGNLDIALCCGYA